MDSIVSSFFIIAFVPMTIAIGSFQIARPFGVLYALPGIILVGLGLVLRNNEMKSSRCIIAAAAGQWLSLLSWIFSRHAISAEEATRHWASDFPSIARAGFPVPAIEIPPPPMGSDVIPADMWIGVFTNHIFWFIVAFFAAKLLLKRITKARSFVVIASAVLGFYALVANLALFAIWYD